MNTATATSTKAHPLDVILTKALVLQYEDALEAGAPALATAGSTHRSIDFPQPWRAPAAKSSKPRGLKDRGSSTRSHRARGARRDPQAHLASPSDHDRGAVRSARHAGPVTRDHSPAHLRLAIPPLEALAPPSTAQEADTLARSLRPALPGVIVMADADGSPLQLRRTMPRHLWSWVADTEPPNRWPLIGIGMALGEFGALPLPITDRWIFDPAQLHRAHALQAAIDASHAPLAVAIAGATRQSAEMALRLARRLPTAPSAHKALQTMLCQIAAYSDPDPVVAHVADRLLQEGFPGSPFELINTARAITT